MSTTDQSYGANQAQPPGKAEPLDTLKALARVLARQAAAEPISGVDPANKPHNTDRLRGKGRQLLTSKRDPHAICRARNRETSDGQATAKAMRSAPIMRSIKTGTNQ